MGHWRKVRGLSQADLAAVLHVTTRTIRNWEAGVTTPTPSQAYIMASLLRVNIRELFPFILL